MRRFDPENSQFSVETLQKVRAKDGEIIVFWLMLLKLMMVN